MNKTLKPYIAMILIIICFSCRENVNEIKGSWESISVENPSPFFTEILKSHEKGEILLIFTDKSKYQWINYKEKLNLSGNCRITGNNIYFYIEKETFPLKVKYKSGNNKLVIVTDDGFIFTFLKIHQEKK
jgi:hypothetical protein